MDNKEEQQQPPTPREAMQFLDDTVSRIVGSRKDHIALQRAVSLVTDALPPEETPEA